MPQPHPTHNPTPQAQQQPPAGDSLPPVGGDLGAAALPFARALAIVAVVACGLCWSPTGQGLALGALAALVLVYTVERAPVRRYLPARRLRRQRRGM